MHLFKRNIDPLHLILVLGFLICMIMCVTTMIQVGELQNEMKQISSSSINTKSDENNNIESNKSLQQVAPVSESSETSNDDIIIESSDVSSENIDNSENIAAQSESIQTESIQTVQQEIFYDQGLFVPSGLSAEQFNIVIEKALSYYNRDPEEYLAYKLGDVFYAIENTYGINSLYMIGITQRESGFNTSDNAKSTNNLTSIMSGVSLKKYNSVEENLTDTARLLKNIYYDKYGLNNIYAVGERYNPVNNTWAPKVQESVNLYYELINTQES